MSSRVTPYLLQTSKKTTRSCQRFSTTPSSETCEKIENGCTLGEFYIMSSDPTLQNRRRLPRLGTKRQLPSTNSTSPSANLSLLAGTLTSAMLCSAGQLASCSKQLNKRIFLLYCADKSTKRVPGNNVLPNTQLKASTHSSTSHLFPSHFPVPSA